jgi:AcrR family transcriptional regulator
MEFPHGSSLRDRTRKAMRDEVASVAIKLFAEQGFDAVTTTQIAQAAGISPRSFFRYFPTKEDVVLGSLEDSGVRVRDALVARPETEGAWEALRKALSVLIEHPVYRQENLEAIASIILNTPSIRSRDLEKYQQWEELLAPDIARRLVASETVGEDQARDSARAVIGAAITALRIATERWLRTGDPDEAAAIIDTMIRAIRTA